MRQNITIESQGCAGRDKEECPGPRTLLRQSRLTTYSLLRPPNLGGCENAASIAPHAVITAGTAPASCGTASLIALSTTLDGFTAASAPTTAIAAPNTAWAPLGR